MIFFRFGVGIILSKKLFLIARLLFSKLLLENASKIKRTQNFKTQNQSPIIKIN